MLRIGYIVVPNFQVMIFGGLTVFEMANRMTKEPHYDIRLISEGGGPVKSSLGYSVMTDSFDDGGFDTVIIGGVIDAVYTASPALINYLRSAVKNTRRVASMCTGAFFLAQAGVLDDRRATTHWAHARELQTTYPRINVEEDRIFIVDGPVWTSAGMTAGTDLAISMVERDLGAKIARTIAKRMVMFHRRAGGQLQHSTLLDLDAKTDRIQTALVYAKSNLHIPLTVDRLAEAANLSVRQFTRAFREETGQTPAKAVENLRLEAARLMVEQGRLPIDVVARETGFADPDRMRRAFLRAFGQPPQAIRRNARDHANG
ncbi:MAG: helix-turn-helix domain protein [Caballeronia sp.]|jgi:transcriptional regulator GlxA family with amidase domain|uniref:GlxA family transcriptional regulator n=1 Tax=Caballeronia sp. TaxID=1931223 RepID=UPI00260E82F2|nr:GlxA family transcriptional regulator [Caballeronia sp.]MDB5835463.1 helix-turn-helix domain protein [Caballeronia sp.]